jgi:hypothetical protein
LQLAAITATLGACVPVAPVADEYDMCESSADCSGSQICDIGVCWGDPPGTEQFAAVLIPPADRPDLAPTELTDFRIAPDGTITGLEFTKTIQLHGRIVIGCADGQTEGCGDTALVPAQVIVEREASFPGGPQYRRTVLTNIEAGLEEDSFSISLPEDGAEYRVTVMPDEQTLDSLASGGLQVQAPPFSLPIRANGDLEVYWEIGKPDQLKSIQGCITSALGNGSAFEGMHVFAQGRWASEDNATRASSIVTTDAEGCFELSVPIDMLNKFDIVARPGPGLTLPTLRLIDEVVLDPMMGDAEPHLLEPLIMPNAANPVTFKLPLYGLSSGGAPEPISGATVFMDTVFEKPVNEERNIEVTFTAKATSNGLGESDEGVAVIELYPGSFDDNRSYTIRVLSPTDSEFASVFDAKVDVGTGEGAPVLEGLGLERRVAVTGALSTANGEPLADTPVTVRPSPLLRRNLDGAGQLAILDNLQFASSLSGPTGEFLLWLDRELLGLMAQYNLDLAPPDFSSAPRWTFEDIPLDADGAIGQESVSLGVLSLPRASYARGDVRDSEGHLIIGAETRWFQVPDVAACPPMTSCDFPARLLGIWETDEAGEVIAVLPDP